MDENSPNLVTLVANKGNVGKIRGKSKDKKLLIGNQVPFNHHFILFFFYSKD
jgi:hypothetical protein